ncbi:MAG TPA: glycosyltransferase [Verrucomicrobiae bacterium]|jgi:GT2 family glycosyltransferase
MTKGPNETPEIQASEILITVVICTRNRVAFLEKAIRSVLPQLNPDTEFIVVDNASTDDTRITCERLREETVYLLYHFEPKLGLSTARNTALTLARGKYILYLDDDAMAEPGWLDAYRNFLTQSPSAKIAVVGGGVISYFSSQPPIWITPGNSRFDLGKDAFLLSSPSLSGANSAYDREAVVAVGLFDEHLGYKGNSFIPREETELQDRLIKAGWECWWLPGAAVQHHVAAERLTVKALATGAFNSGRGAAIHRLKTKKTKFSRIILRMARILTVPFHAVINLVQCVVLFSVGKQADAIGALCRVTRALGWGWQMITH